MNETTWERWGAVSGLVGVALGVAGATFERGAPGVDAAPEQVAAFFRDYRTELLAQSLLMVLSAGALLWFLGSLRSYLARAEGGDGHLATVAFAAGVLGFGLQAAIQAPQSALAMASDHPLDPQLAAMISDLGGAISVVAYVPVDVMLGAVAVVALHTRALPTWLGWLSAAVAITYLVASAGIAVDTGPLARGGWATYVPYTLTVVWLVAVPAVILARTRDSRAPTPKETGHRSVSPAMIRAGRRP